MARIAASSGAGMNTQDLEIRQLPVLDLTSPMAGVPIHTLESVEDAALPRDHADRLQFMEEPVEIRLEPSGERNPPKTVRCSVNGDRRWIPVGIPVRLRRKFVEVLARAQPYTVETDVGTTNDERPHNRVIRTSNRRHPFTVLKDDNPRAAAWLNKVMYEG